MRRPAALLAVLAALSAPALALAGPLQVAVDHTVKLSFSGPAASVVVGNPAVADVQVVDSRTVFVAGRSYGSTDVTIIDSLGRTLFSQEVQVAPRRGQVAVYRGAARTDMSCDPTCGLAVASAAAAASSPSAPGSATAAASTAAGLPGAVIPQPLMGALGAAASPR